MHSQYAAFATPSGLTGRMGQCQQPLFCTRSTPLKRFGLDNRRVLQTRRAGILPVRYTTTSIAGNVAADEKELGPQNDTDDRVKFPSLRPDAFRHPVDVKATRFVQRLFGLETGIRLLLRNVEQMFVMENLATGVRVSDKQYPSIQKMLVEACTVLDLPVPSVYVRNHPTPNAYTLAFRGSDPFIVVHSALIELLTPRELQAVIAHELGHLKCEHGTWATVGNVIVLLSSMTADNIIGRILFESLQMQLLAWQRSAELSCDRAMLLVMQDTKVAISALMKLCGGSSKYSDEMDVDEFIAQADKFDKVSNTVLGSRMRRVMTTRTTHPLPILRVRELKRWSESNHFRALLQSGKPLSTTTSGSFSTG